MGRNPLAELGLDDGEGPLSVTLHITTSMEETLRQTLVGLTKNSKDVNRIMKVVGYAAATYLVLAGVARLIEAQASIRGGDSRGDRDRDDGDN